MPYELLNKRFRATQKTIDRETSSIAAATNEFSARVTGSSNKITVGEASTMLDNVVQRLQSLKRKVCDVDLRSLGVACSDSCTCLLLEKNKI